MPVLRGKLRAFHARNPTIFYNLPCRFFALVLYFYEITERTENAMRTLYLSDLDGTLLNQKTELTSKTGSILNGLMEQGLCFSIATARSRSSALPIIHKLNLTCPAIFHNGTFLMDPGTGEILSAELFSPGQRQTIRSLLNRHRLHPVCYAFLEGRERLSYRAGEQNEGMEYYLHKRREDPRMRECCSEEELYDGEIYYFTCIGSREELSPVYEEVRRLKGFRCVFQQELYRPEYWLEIMPENASKAHGMEKLKELLHCDRVVVFGDALNDLPMFKAADEAYAVANAAEELKQAATGIIGSNEEDGVADWLLNRLLQG